MRYLSGGMLGDFWMQLSVVYEKYLQTKERAILYITDTKGDYFRNGINETYHDIFFIIMGLDYIDLFKIHDGEVYDVDLTIWRESTQTFYVDRIQECYGVEWGKHPWLHHIPMKQEWSDRIIINTTHYRFAGIIDWNMSGKWYGQNQMWFVSSEDTDYEQFKIMTGWELPHYKPKDFIDLCTVIASCKMVIGSMSAPMSIAYSLHKPCILGYHRYESLFMRLDTHARSICYHMPTLPELESIQN